MFFDGVRYQGTLTAVSAVSDAPSASSASFDNPVLEEFELVHPVKSGKPPSASAWPPLPEAREKALAELRKETGTRSASGKKFRYYAIFSAPGECRWLLGIWHAPWVFVEALLPGGRLCGSGVVLQGFDDEQSAAKHYLAKTYANESLFKSGPVVHELDEARRRLNGTL